MYTFGFYEIMNEGDGSPTSEWDPDVCYNVVAVKDKEPGVGGGGDATVLRNDLDPGAQRN